METMGLSWEGRRKEGARGQGGKGARGGREGERGRAGGGNRGEGVERWKMAAGNLKLVFEKGREI